MTSVSNCCCLNFQDSSEEVRYHRLHKAKENGDEATNGRASVGLSDGKWWVVCEVCVTPVHVDVVTDQLTRNVYSDATHKLNTELLAIKFKEGKLTSIHELRCTNQLERGITSSWSLPSEDDVAPFLSKHFEQFPAEVVEEGLAKWKSARRQRKEKHDADEGVVSEN